MTSPPPEGGSAQAAATSTHPRVVLLDGTAGLARQPAFGGPAFPLPADGALTNFEAKYEVEGRSRHRATWRRLVP